MSRNPVHWLRRSSILIALVVLSGCADESPLAPGAEPPALREPAENNAVVASGVMTQGRATDFGPCTDLQVPAGHNLALRTYAHGVQIYHWNGTGWSFDGPSAVLTADAAGKSVVGSHYVGPTWESNSGSKVVGALVQPCVVDPNSIPWLLLRADTSHGPGIFRGVTFIQRVNTAGGKAPSRAGEMLGEEVRVPYTTEYLFYRAHGAE